ncbi:unnamed protein product [Gulo gulo]|uniref:Uncharacterized protein n=1 Tax=Gulo gulo TaxID=48420 RepID=A0A9X9PZV5_GULGU|nr:unnamed protein product [Gulo gulo]
MNGETSESNSSGIDTCRLSRPLRRRVPPRPLRSGVLARRPLAPPKPGLVVGDPALGAAAAPPPPPQEMELGPLRLLLPGGGGGRWGETHGGGDRRGLDEVLLALQVEGAAHALAETESCGRAGVAVHRAGVEAVRQVAGGVRTERVRPGPAPHRLQCETRRQEAAVGLQLQVQLPAEGVQAKVRGGVSRRALQCGLHQLLVFLCGAPARARQKQQRRSRREQ